MQSLQILHFPVLTRRIKNSRIISGLMLLCASPLLWANELVGMDYSVMTGNSMQFVFTFSDDVATPRSFTIDNPARIAIDFPDTENKLKQRNQPIGVGVVQNVISAEARGRTRVVLNLAQSTNYETKVNANQVILTLSDKVDNDFNPQAAGSPIASAQPKQNGRGIIGIDFKRGSKGEGRVIVELTDPSVSTDVWRAQDTINIEFISASLPELLQRRLDVSDFATPINFIDTTQDGSSIRMSIAASGDFEHLAYQTDNILTVEIQPISKEEQEEKRKDKFGFTGERLSLNFQDIEVRSVLQLLADFTGLNLVVSDSVSGNLTLRLNNVPWDQAMDIILKTKGLDKRQSGNVILVAPTDEIAAREKLELEAQRQFQELEALRTEFIKVNYAKASEMATLLKLKDNAMLSPRGSVSVDERTNTLLVKDTTDSIANVRLLLSELDIPVRQVLIESRIVIASDDFSKELGVRFGVSNDGFGATDTGTNVVTSGTIGSGGGTVGLINDTSNQVSILEDGLNVNMPLQNPAGSFALALAKLPLGTLIQLELSAAQIEGRGEVVSSPRVITANSHTARIEQGVEIPYLELSDGSATLKFRKAVLSLETTPQITPDDRIIMDLEVHKDSVGETVSFGQGLSAPSIDTREVQSQVLVDNGQTVVLGGIYETVKATQTTRVPFFSDLPIIGNLFKSNLAQDDRSELLIFVTPKILHGDELALQ